MRRDGAITQLRRGCAKTDDPENSGRPLKIRFYGSSVLVTLKQGKYGLRGVICRSEHTGAGLHENLVSR
jgi:hypothetical protein